jgi:mRNA-degrading endonuclease RelE of RelBE toxin-antitoxin system
VRYKVVVVRGAQKSLLAIPSPYFEQIEAKLRDLADSPRPHGCKKLEAGTVGASAQEITELFTRLTILPPL